METSRVVSLCRDCALPADDCTDVKSYKPVLLVEDERINQKVFSAYLTQLGYGFDVAKNGLEALQALEIRRYGVVLMDIMMPVMDGLETVSIIRDTGSDVLDHEVAVIAMTAGYSGHRQDILAKGMNDCLFKPVRFSALKTVLAYWLPGAADGYENAGDGSSLTDDTSVIDDEVLLLFAAKAPEYVLAVKMCLSGGNSAGAQFHAHKLAGAAASVGAVRLARHAVKMEMLAGNGDIIAAGHEQQRLVEELDRLLAALAGCNQSERTGHYE